MRHIILFTTLFIFAFILSCDQEQPKKDVTTQVYGAALDTLSIEKPSNLKPYLKLTPQAQKGIENWSLYINLSKATDSLPSSTLGDLKINLDRFALLYEAEKEAEEAEAPITPQEVQTNAINARLIAIQTRVNALQNEANRNMPNVENLSSKIGSLQNAYQDLNLQLNELYNTNIKDLLEEIKEENRLQNIVEEESESISTPIITENN